MPVKKDNSKKGNRQNITEQIVHEFHIISEGLVSQIKQVAEGVANIDQKLDRTCQELKAEIDEKTQPIAQAVVSLDQKLDRTRLELKAEIDEKTQPIAQAVVSLDGKVNSLDAKVSSLDGKVNSLDAKVSSLDGKVNSLDAKVSSLDGKLDRIHQELKSEIQETRQEILAAVKFSYAELDKRLTTLEKEFLDLKHRVEKIESRSVS